MKQPRNAAPVPEPAVGRLLNHINLLGHALAHTDSLDPVEDATAFEEALQDLITLAHEVIAMAALVHRGEALATTRPTPHPQSEPLRDDRSRP